MSYQEFAVGVRRILNQPGKVALLCLFFFSCSLVFSGNLWRLWGLHRDSGRITREIQETHSAISQLQAQLKQAKDPAFIERQARDKLDMVGEHDLVFVFSDQ